MATETQQTVETAKTGSAPAAQLEVIQGAPSTAVAPEVPANEAEYLSTMADSLGDFLSEATKAELLKNAGKTGTQPAAPAAEQKPAEQKPGDNPAATTEKPVTTEEKPADAGYKSKFGLGKSPTDKKGGQPAAIVIETPDHVLDVVKSRFGMEVKSIGELPKFFETAQTWRKDAEQYKKVSDDHKKLTDSIQSLPAEFFEAFDMIATGQDWRKAFETKSKLDFSVAADKQDKKALVNHFYPGKFTEEDFKEETPSDQLKAYTETSIDKFLVAKERYENERAKRADEGTKQLAAYKSSSEGSVHNLKRDFPETDAEIVTEISSVLEGGPQSVMSFFFEQNGTVKPEAAMMLMMAKYGKEEIEGMMAVASKRAETVVNEDLLTRGSDGPKPTQKTGHANDGGLTDADRQKIEELKNLKTANKQTFS